MKKLLIIDFIIEILTVIFLIYFIIRLQYTPFGCVLLFFMINLLALIYIFYNYIKKCDLYISNYNFFNIKNKEDVEIECKKIKNTYFMEYNGKKIEFRTNETLFGNQMFFSYLVRNIRFIEVSEKRPMIYIFKRKVKLQNMNLHNLTIIINGKKYLLVKNGISISKFNLINRSYYWTYFLGGRTSYKAMMKDINFINEKKFQNGKVYYNY